MDTSTVEMNQGHTDLLRAIADLQGDDNDKFPSTRDVGKKTFGSLQGKGWRILVAQQPALARD